jgi:hypothetical protein
MRTQADSMTYNLLSERAVSRINKVIVRSVRQAELILRLSRVYGAKLQAEFGTEQCWRFSQMKFWTRMTRVTT